MVKNDIYKDLDKILKKQYPKFSITLILDLGNYYVINAIPTSMKQTEDSYIVDGFHKIDKKTKKLSGFSPMMDLESFKEANKHPVYVSERG